MADQLIGDPRVGEIVANANADLAPRRIPYVLRIRRLAILEELDGHAFALGKNHISVSVDDKSGVGPEIQGLNYSQSVECRQSPGNVHAWRHRS